MKAYVWTFAMALLLLFSSPAAAQNASQPASAADATSLKAAELDALVAPIALYPDPLVSLVLMASTYPLEVVQADRWVKENKKFKGDQLKAEVEKQTWDDSVKSLVATPDVLSMLSSKLDWTLKLGNAVLAQQPDVMDAIQRLRTKADANKKLTSTKEQTVSRRQEQGKEVIVIEPTNPETIYVPYYDPAVVYGEWPYPEYPAYSLGWPGYIAGGLIASGIAYGAGYALGRWSSGGNYWGGGCNWGDRNININRPRVNPLGGNNWQHNPAHRKGVRYNNPHVSARFGDNSLRGGNQNRMDFRGRGGNQVLRPDTGDRPGAGQRPGGGDRPGAGQRPGGGDRPGAGQRPGGGDRLGAGQRPGGGDRPGAGQRPGGGDRPGAGQRPGGQRPSAGQRPSGGRPSAGQRPSGPRGGGNALGNIGSGRVAHMQSGRGHASLGGRGGGSFRGGGGGFRGGGGGGFRGGGGRGGGRGGGGRRSDITLKHDVILLGHLSNGLGFYRFSYVGNDRAYVGVIAQEVQQTMPKAVVRDKEGYLRVLYERLGIRFQTYEQWIASGARIPTISH